MNEQYYKIHRAKLIREFYFLKGKRLNRSAAARVRLIAKLDHEQNGTPIEETKRLFKYDELDV